jgi:UrcA family protein
MSKAARSPMALIPGLALAAALFAAAPTLAQSDGVTLQVKVADLQTVAGQADVRRRIEAAADAYCRGNPAGVSTVADCRASLVAQLEQKLTTQTGIALGDTGPTRLASK